MLRGFAQKNEGVATEGHPYRNAIEGAALRGRPNSFTI